MTLKGLWQNMTDMGDVSEVEDDPQSLDYLALGGTVTRSEAESGFSIAGVLFWLFVVMALAALMGWGL